MPVPLERKPEPSQRELHEAYLIRFYEQYAFKEDEEEEEEKDEEEEEISRFPPHWRPHRWCRFVGKPVETPQVPFFGQGFLVVVSGGVGQTMQNTVENPQLQFWDKVFMPVCCVWCLWPDSVGTVEIPQQQFLDRVYMPVVAGLVPMARQLG